MKKICVLFALAFALVSFGFTAIAEETIVFYNATDYIDPELLEQFTEETGINVKYVVFDSNEMMYMKLTAGSADYDLICPSDYMIERLVKEDMLAEIDYSKVPNAAGLADWLWEADFDTGLKHCVPYMWGTMGILYNIDYVDEDITSWSALFDPSFKNDVLMLDSIRDQIGVMLKYLGHPLNSHEEADLAEVRDLLLKQKAAGIVQGYLMDEVKDKMVGGEAAMAIMWSGEAMYAIMENDALKYVIPEEGSNVFVDALCILKTSEHYEACLKLIDFLCRHDVALANYDYIHYASPISSIYEEIPEEEVENPAVNPTDDMLERCEFFHDILDYIDIYNKYWMEIRA